MSSKLCHVVQEVADEALHLAQCCSEGGSLGTRSPKDLQGRCTLRGAMKGEPPNE